MHSNNDPKPDFTGKIRVVVDREPCTRHVADTGTACFYLEDRAGICNQRAIKAGFNGKVNAQSMNTRRVTSK